MKSRNIHPSGVSALCSKLVCEQIITAQPTLRLHAGFNSGSSKDRRYSINNTQDNTRLFYRDNLSALVAETALMADPHSLWTHNTAHTQPRIASKDMGRSLRPVRKPGNENNYESVVTGAIMAGVRGEQGVTDSFSRRISLVTAALEPSTKRKKL